MFLSYVQFVLLRGVACGDDVNRKVCTFQNTVIPRLTSDPANQFFG